MPLRPFHQEATSSFFLFSGLTLLTASIVLSAQRTKRLLVGLWNIVWPGAEEVGVSVSLCSYTERPWSWRDIFLCEGKWVIIGRWWDMARSRWTMFVAVMVEKFIRESAILIMGAWGSNAVGWLIDVAVPFSISLRTDTRIFPPCNANRSRSGEKEIPGETSISLQPYIGPESIPSFLGSMPITQTPVFLSPFIRVCWIGAGPR